MILRALQHTLQHTPPHFCNILQHTATSAVPRGYIFDIVCTATHTATHSNTLLQHTATHGNAKQHKATHCNIRCTLRVCIRIPFEFEVRKPLVINTMQHTAKHCNTLQRTATHCNHCNTLQHTATHYNTLQHTATSAVSRGYLLEFMIFRCNTLQHCFSRSMQPLLYGCL